MSQHWRQMVLLAWPEYNVSEYCPPLHEFQVHERRTRDRPLNLCVHISRIGSALDLRDIVVGGEQ